MAVTATYRVPGAILTEREHRIPLDHAHPDGRSLSVFTREVADPDGLDRPYLVFLQGGPGFEAARPTGIPRGPGWLDDHKHGCNRSDRRSGRKPGRCADRLSARHADRHEAAR